jgi:hypothetical protein
MNILNEYYREEIESAIKAVQEEYAIEPCDETDSDFPPAIKGDNFRGFKIRFPVDQKPVTIILCMPPTFP